MTTPQPRKVVELSGTAEGHAGAHATLSITTHLSASHIQSAAFLAREAARIERTVASQVADASQVDEAVRADHRACVIGAVFMAVAFLEATINELFDANPPKTAAYAIVWQQFLSGKASIHTLKKYQVALQLVQKPLLDSSVTLYRDANVLSALRDRLVHFEPSQHWEDGVKQPKLQGQLSGKFMAMNPLYPPNSHFLYVYLGHGCAAWAVQSAMAFTDDFFQRLGDAPPYEHVRHRLNTLPSSDAG